MSCHNVLIEKLSSSSKGFQHWMRIFCCMFLVSRLIFFEDKSQTKWMSPSGLRNWKLWTTLPWRPSKMHLLKSLLLKTWFWMILIGDRLSLQIRGGKGRREDAEPERGFQRHGGRGAFTRKHNFRTYYFSFSILFLLLMVVGFCRLRRRESARCRRRKGNRKRKTSSSRKRGNAAWSHLGMDGPCQKSLHRIIGNGSTSLQSDAYGFLEVDFIIKSYVRCIPSLHESTAIYKHPYIVSRNLVLLAPFSTIL